MTPPPERRDRRPRGSSLRLFPLVVLLAAHGLSLIGNAITIIVVPLYVLDLTGSVSATGVAGAFATVPIIIGGVLGGVMVDRLGFRAAAVISDLASGVTVLAIPLLAHSFGMPFGLLLLLVFLSGLLDTPGRTAKESLLPDLANEAGIALTRAAASSAAISRSASLLGAAGASVLLVAIGALNSLIVDSLTFVVSAVLIGLVLPRSVTSTPPHVALPRRVSFREQLKEGVSYIVNTPLVRNIVILVVVTNLIDAAGFLVLFPVYGRGVTPDGSFLGLIMGCFAAGAVVGALLFARWGHRLPRRALLVGGFAIAGPVPYIAMLVDLSPQAFLVAMLCAGLAAGSLNPLLSAALYSLVPRAIRARVLGALTTGVTVGMPVGSLLAGVTVEAWGLLPVLVGAVVIYCAAALSPLVGKSWVLLKEA
ncbi:MFS transporter [Rhodoglobus sp. NPDC076762]